MVEEKDEEEKLKKEKFYTRAVLACLIWTCARATRGLLPFACSARRRRHCRQRHNSGYEQHTMSSVPQDNASAFQFQFKHQYPANYPMSQAQQQYQAQQAQQVSQTTTTTPQASTSQSVAGPSSSNQSQSATQADPSTQQTQTQSRMEAERARKDRTLAEFMLMLDDYEPLVSTMFGTKRWLIYENAKDTK